MTAAFLQSELTSLISDSKRKHAEIKSAADKSLSDLKSISVTSETQLAGDLVRRPLFIDPFLLACKSQNVKLASTGAACLQRLVASTAIPRSRLPDILQAFEEAVTLALDVQLKILQTLPSLLQLYNADLHGEALARTLSVCADLSSSKLPLVSNTAGATFQQLVSAVFSRLPTSSRATKSQSDDEVNSARDRQDALAIFVDLCALFVQGEPKFVRLENLPPGAVLETLESLLVAHGASILREPDARKACAETLIPGLCNLVENSSTYNIVIRAIRIGFVLATQYLSTVARNLDVFLSLTIRIADRTANQPWKRAACLELYRGICTDFTSLRNIFNRFDLQEKKANVVSDIMATLVRIASEDPSLIGLGRQSTIPMSATNEGGPSTDATADVPIASASHSSPAAKIGISAEWSKMSAPCLDMVDRVTALEVPETYIYTLVLECISAISDGLSRYIMPLSVPQRKPTRIEDSESTTDEASDLQRRPSLQVAVASQTQDRLVNPLTRTDLTKFEGVTTCAKIIEACWPAVLATCSTFLNAALDSYFYHMLIRTAQRLTQVSGVLELHVPRDALLTTLAKASVPANVSNLMNLHYGSRPALEDSPEEEVVEEGTSVKSPGATTPRQSIDLSGQSLNMRNLLCLRALLNLGIALGPDLSQDAWIIILQALQQVDALMTVGPTARVFQLQNGVSETQDTTVAGSLGTEISAVDTARRRMLDSTKGYTNEAFANIGISLLRMIGDVIPKQEKTPQQTGGNSILRPQAVSHRSARSVSGHWAKTATLEVEVQFFLKTIGRMASVNLDRFRTAISSASSWDLIVLKLLDLHGNRKLQPQLRLQSANIIDAIVVEVCTAKFTEVEEDDATSIAVVTQYGIPALGKQLDNIQPSKSNSQAMSESTLLTVQNMLQALQNVVGSCGDQLGSGWSAVFKILGMVVAASGRGSEDKMQARLMTAAFKVVQLTTSDFLPVLDLASIEALISLLEAFARSKSDLNMALTSTALYWNVATLLLNSEEHSASFLAPSDTLKGDLSTSGLWQQSIMGLAGLCREDTTDLRNAALRMLLKVAEASVMHMSSNSVNVCLETAMVPLINFYAGKAEAGASQWKESIVTIVHDLSNLLQAHSSLILTDESSFRQMWTLLIAQLKKVLECEDIKLASIIFDALSNIIAAFGQCENSSILGEDKAVFEATWFLWRDHQPLQNISIGPNIDALASHARLLQTIATASHTLLTETPDSHTSIFAAARLSIFAARHDQYTRDVNKMSKEQNLALETLRTSDQLSGSRDSWYAVGILNLIGDIVKRTEEVQKGLDSSKPDFRKPTGIALATACIEEMRHLMVVASQQDRFWPSVPANSVLSLSAKLARTKYGTLPNNSQNPLWKKASVLGTDCLTNIREHWSSRNEDLDLTELGQHVNDLTNAILKAPNLDNLPPDDRPAKEVILEEEQFDIKQLHILHSSTSSSILPTISQVHTKTYILTLFQSSLTAEPWYNDLTNDLNNDPLANFTTIRRGSIRAPNLPIRQKIYIEALRSLFDLVSTNSKPQKNPPVKNNNPQPSEIPSLAAPYILLRLAHPLKSFITDQPLRYLQHPHRALQHELATVLTLFTALRVQDSAFIRCAETLNCNTSTTLSSTATNVTGDGDGNGDGEGDGKIHLRILWNLMTRFEEAWFKAPRLKKGHAWQGFEDGVAVERALREWRGAVSEGWGARF